MTLSRHRQARGPRQDALLRANSCHVPCAARNDATTAALHGKKYEVCKRPSFVPLPPQVRLRLAEAESRATLPQWGETRLTRMKCIRKYITND